LICAAMMVALLLQQATHTGSPADVSIENNEVWLQTASGSRQITHDGVPKRLATLAPSGEGVAYVIDKEAPNNALEETVVLVNRKGEVLQRIVPEGYVPGDFDRLEWIDDQRIGAMVSGHANCMYWVLNPGSGKTIQVMRGGFDFIWSHNRRYVARRRFAYYGNVPEGEPLPEHDSVCFTQDDVTVYPPETGRQSLDDAETHDLGRISWGPFIWSPRDEWIAFPDVVGPEGDNYLVLVSPKGEILRETLSIDIGPDTSIEWLDDTHLDLNTSGKTFHFVIKGKQLTEVASR